MKEAEDFNQFIRWYMQSSLMYNTHLVLSREGNKIIASIPEEIDLDSYWLRPEQHDLFWIDYNNFNLPKSGSVKFKGDHSKTSTCYKSGDKLQFLFSFTH